MSLWPMFIQTLAVCVTLSAGLSPTQVPFVTPSETVRIAIVGSGAAGSSTAYFLRRWANESGFPLELTVYEKNSVVGGRAKAFQLPEEPIPTELGGSVIASINRNILRVARQLNVPLLSLSDEDEDSTAAPLGVWDGSRWLYRSSPSNPASSVTSWFSGSWKKVLSTVSFVYRYGLWNGPIKAGNLAKDMASDFVRMYDRIENGSYYESLNDMLSASGAHDAVSVTARSFFERTNGVNVAFTEEILGGILHNIYNQDVGDIHAFGALVAYYCGQDQLYKIRDGNFVLFQAMLGAAQANVRLNTTVTKVDRDALSADWKVTLGDGVQESYDHVVLALPQPQVTVTVDGIAWPTKLDYVHVFGMAFFKRVDVKWNTQSLGTVTVVVGSTKPSYFGLDTQLEIPDTILIPSFDANKDQAPFTSMVITDRINNTHSLVKFFSLAVLDDVLLSEIFDYKSGISVTRWPWDSPGAYPYLRPFRNTTATFEIAPGLWHPNIMEQWVSTLETETVAGRNVANGIWASLSRPSST